MDDLLLSTDRFGGDDHDIAGLTADDRRRLLELLGLFGVRLSRELLRKQRVATSQELARELRRQSGIDELKSLLTAQFASRSDVLKARVGLAVLDRLTRSFPLDDGGVFATELERVEADAHELAEMRLLVAVRTGAMELDDDEIAEVERLVERAGLRPVERLALGIDTPDDEIRHALKTRVEHWRRRAEHPLAPRATFDAASIVARSYEGMLLELTPS